MGLLKDIFGLTPVNVSSVEAGKKVEAQTNPAIYNAPFGTMWGNYGWGGYNNYANVITRMNAMSVPAVSQCRSLICNTVASIPLEMYSDVTGAEVPSPSWVKQPDLRAPREVTIAWTCDSLLMYGIAFWRVSEIFADDLRPSRFEWISNDRVSTKMTEYGAEVEYYMVDNQRVPDSGIGSLVTFQAFDNGLLLKAARTINSAIEIEKAANIASQTPMPSGIIKNNGADLPPEEVQGLLNQWKNSRNGKSTAYLTATLEFQPSAFSPKDMMYNDAAQFLAAQIARACNVPAWMINAEMQKSMTYQNVLDSRKEFFAYTIQPYVSAIEARLSMDDLTPRGSKIRFSVDETFLRTNAIDRLAVIEKMLQLNLITLDQAKAMESLSPEGDGEVDAAPNI